MVLSDKYSDFSIEKSFRATCKIDLESLSEKSMKIPVHTVTKTETNGDITTNRDVKNTYLTRIFCS